ncbi:sce7725 family protein [Elizabethkingia anophelis]|uniref:sce7725 family protein n=1 Tax=Elizabethkingia anophelis TaxID=1117645 RepID=UPI0016275C0B|nr:sce7725 family protein [Elizabethkingia anophelis]MCT4006729.1 sce7725 family protein [Elizabethkingia anophelis]
MYQPYIRGKQFELIGLKELIQPVLIRNKAKISPIIEPVKDSSTLKSTIKELASNDINFTVIVNPRVGNIKNTEAIFNAINQSVGDYKNYQIGVIFHDKINHEQAIKRLEEFASAIPALSIIHNAQFDNISKIIASYEEVFTIKYNVINLASTSRRYFRNFEKETLIELDDYFNAQTKNSDYLKVGESNFSEEHLYYKDEGFEGFADYLSIGEEYSESGFLPYAVAIHLSYAEDDKKIKIKHFVSDSNSDTSDIAGKFAEALEKLITWCNKTGYNSIAVPTFRDYHQNGHFPGLGTIKKLSMMNHIDLVLKLI